MTDLDYTRGHTHINLGIHCPDWVLRTRGWPRREYKAPRHRSFAAYARLKEIAQSTAHKELASLACRKADQAAWDLRRAGVRGDVDRLVICEEAGRD